MRIVLGLALALAASQAAGETLIERGAYLAGSVMNCHGCHTPRGPGGLDLSRAFSGGPQVFDETDYKVVGSNITPDKETGIGNWSEAQFANAMRKGWWKGLEGSRPLLPPMPWPNFAHMPDADISAIYAYLMSTTPVENVVPAPVPPDQL